MKNITSKDNPTYKNAMKLLRKKYRDQEGKYLIEGIKPLTDAVNAGITVETVFVREGDDSGIIPEEGVNTMCLSRDLFDNLSETETSQGVIAIATKNLKEPEQGNVIILDRLQDPGNIGTIIRTAEAAGFRAIITVKGTGDIYSPKTVRAAAGALFRMPVIEGLDTEEAVRFCRERGLKVTVTALEGAKECYDADLRDTAIVIGNEGQGVSDEMLMAADEKVKIPMEGEIESLNAAVAAAVLMYESARQTSTAGKVK